VTATRRLAVWTVGLALLSGCLPHPPTPPPPMIGTRAVAILPPTNLTGDELLVAGGSMLETYVLRADHVTVPDLLASEAEVVLRARGYQATARAARPGDADGSRVGLRLSLEIRRWEPDSWTHPQFVIVGVSATLTDGAKEVWSARPAIHHVATPGAVILGSAYEIAARQVVDELLASWQPREPG